MTNFTDALRKFQADHGACHPELSDAALERELRREDKDRKRAIEVQTLLGDIDTL